MTDHRYKKEYTVLGKKVEVVVSIFVEEKDENILEVFKDIYDQIVSECLFPKNPTCSLADFSITEVETKVANFLIDKLTPYDINNITASFAHYSIVRYIESEKIDEITYGLEKKANATGVVYKIKDEIVNIASAKNAKILHSEYDFDIDDEFMSMIKSSEDTPEGKTREENDPRGRNRIWLWLIIIFCIVIALILLLGRNHPENQDVIGTGDTVEQTDSSNNASVKDNKKGNRFRDTENPSIRTGSKSKDPVKNNSSKDPVESNNGKDPANNDGNSSTVTVSEKNTQNTKDEKPVNTSKNTSQTNQQEKSPVYQTTNNEGKSKQRNEINDVIEDTIVFPYGVYYGEYKVNNGKRYPSGVGVMKYNKRTALKSIDTRWHYRHVRAGYELVGIWEGEIIKCGTLFDGSMIRVVLDSVPCK